MKTYKIIRFRFEGKSRTIKKEHCQRDDTEGDGWFDGYAEE